MAEGLAVEGGVRRGKVAEEEKDGEHDDGSLALVVDVEGMIGTGVFRPGLY